MSVLLATLVCFAGFAALALAMPKHWRTIVPGSATPPALAFRIAAAVLLTVACAVLVHAYGAAVGSVAWFGTLTAGALLVVMALTFPATVALLVTGAAAAGALWAILA